jgi:outer membrane lipoprotein SlyB
MRSILISAFVLMMGMVSLPASAAGTVSDADFYSATMNQGTIGHLQPVAAINTHDIKNMTLAQAAAIIGGAIVGGTIVDRIVDGTAFTVLGVVAGAVFGNEWYDRGMWPF